MSNPSPPRSSLVRCLGATVCALMLTLVACEDEKSGDDGAEPGTSTGMTTPDPPDTSSSSSDGGESSSSETGSESTGAPSCGSTELCSRTINECEIELTQEQCELWYSDPAQNMCDDIDGYTVCNCNCVEEPTCDEYFSCGMLCFEDFC